MTLKAIVGLFIISLLIALSYLSKSIISLENNTWPDLTFLEPAWLIVSTALNEISYFATSSNILGVINTLDFLPIRCVQNGISLLF